MHRRRRVLVLSLVSLLLAGGLVVGSNMGFRWAPTFTQTNVDRWVSLPYFNDLARASDLCNVVPGASLVSRFEPAGSIRVDWTCPFGNNFGMIPGEGVVIRVSASSNPVFFGSHDPELTVPPGGFQLAGQDYLVSIPYHTTATSANDVCGEVPNATLVSRFDPGTATRVDWTCPFGNNFPVSLGEALAIRVSAPSAGFLPSHY